MREIDANYFAEEAKAMREHLTAVLEAQQSLAPGN